MRKIIQTRAHLIVIFTITLIVCSCKSPTAPAEKVVTASEQSVDSSKASGPDSVKAAFVNLPSPIGWTSDFENLFSIRQKKTLDSIIDAFEKRTSIEIAIITLDTSRVTKEKFDDYALQLSRTWGVGKKKENNGVTITISAGHRRIRINNGYGIEKMISNEETQEIIDNTILPQYKKNRYYQGTLNGLKVIINTIDNKLLSK